MITKATRIRKLLLTGASASTVAKATKCHTSYVYMIKKAMDKDTGVVPRDEDGATGWKKEKRMNMDAHSSGVQFDAPKSILDEAKDIIYGDREKTYGAPDKNLVAIAGYWSNHLLTRFGVFHEITGADVCVMMTLLKAARLGNDVTHRDSLVDAVGYLALLERIQK